MSREEQVEKLTAYMANFIGYTAKVLPDDVIAKLDELAEREDGFLPKVIYQTMKKNQKLAKELDRPSCQDTGVLQSSPSIFSSFSVNRRSGSSFERGCDPCNFSDTAPAQ